MLALSKVSVRFTDEADKNTLALKDITFSVKKGAFVSIAGPSGAGKSTLMRTILGLMPHESGIITRNFNRAAMVFQNYALFPWLTALENVSFGLRMQNMEKADRTRLAREKMREVGLVGFEQHYPGELSGGQRQRVGLARALAVSPDLLIMDEPFSSLDTITAEALKKDLLSIWRSYGITILMVNHLIPDAIELSDEVVVMGAHPGHIEKIMQIPLIRPRETRDPHFYEKVDELTEVIRGVF
jgi:NitT/TauT family transport system ATP-binding protein